MSVINLSKILAKYKKGWLAFSSDWKLVSTGKTLDEVLAKAKKKGVADPSVMKAAPVENLMVG